MTMRFPYMVQKSMRCPSHYLDNTKIVVHCHFNNHHSTTFQTELRNPERFRATALSLIADQRLPCQIAYFHKKHGIGRVISFMLLCITLQNLRLIFNTFKQLGPKRHSTGRDKRASNMTTILMGNNGNWGWKRFTPQTFWVMKWSGGPAL